MIRWFRRDPLKKLESEYAEKTKLARDVQRSGDIVRYSAIMAEAEEIGLKIDRLKAESVRT